jgi:hypothetical protein
MRAEIRAMMLAHPAAAEPLTWKHIQPRLSRPLSERAIQWHMKAVRSEVAVGAIYISSKLTQHDVHGNSERLRESDPADATALLLDSRSRGHDRPLAQYVVPNDRGGNIADSASRPPALGSRRRTGSAAMKLRGPKPFDRLAEYKDRELNESDQIWEPEWT